jgi:hypothetical protein
MIFNVLHVKNLISRTIIFQKTANPIENITGILVDIHWDPTGMGGPIPLGFLVGICLDPTGIQVGSHLESR